MNCASCGAVLPAGAMFCGRCGRAVNAAPVPRARVIDPRPGDTTILIPSTLTVRQQPAVDAAGDVADRSGLPVDAGSAGVPRVTGTAGGGVADASQRDRDAARPGGETAGPDGDAARSDGDAAGPDGDAARPGGETAGPDGDAAGPSDGAAEVESDTSGESAEPSVRDAEQPVRDAGVPVGGAESPVQNTEPPDSAVGRADRFDRFGPSGSDVSAGLAHPAGAVSESLIATRPAAIVTSGGDTGVATGTAARGGSAAESSPRQPPVPYVLSFSTGERVVVVGSGLLGRRPYVQPGESFDQLVSIADYERSVSKTHLEFGIEDGDLWICDRYSANGTVIIPPSGAPHRLEPGRRYRVPRAGRVEIGDRWFDVR